MFLGGRVEPGEIAGLGMVGEFKREELPEVASKWRKRRPKNPTRQRRMMNAGSKKEKAHKSLVS